MTLTHTKGPFTIQGNHVHDLQFQEPLDGRNLIVTVIEGRQGIEANLSLIARFDEVPHTCTDALCPGMVNQRKLEACEALVKAADGFLERIAYVTGIEPERRDFIAAIAKAEGRD